MNQHKKHHAKFKKATNNKQYYIQKEPNTPKKYQEKNVVEKKEPKYIQKCQKQQFRQDNYSKEIYCVKQQEFQQRQKIKTSRIPDHIIDASFLVDEQELGLAVEARYIKKYFLQKFMEAAKEQLKIRKAKYTPCIFFQFCNKNRRYQYVQYKDLVRCNKKRFVDNPQLISFIYQQLYDRVEPKYFRLAVFGIKIGKEKHIPITNLSVFRQENIQTQLMFYYCLNKKKELNFLLIDKYLNFVYFYTQDILRWSQVFQDQYDLYVKFHKAVAYKEKKQYGDAWDILQNEEIIFNENELKYFCESLQNLQKKLQKHILKAQKQLVEVQQQLKQKKKKFQKISKQQSNQILALEKMQLEIMKMQQKINYLKRTIKDIQVQKKSLSYKSSIDQWFYIKSAKRIILAQKEMTSKLPILERKKQILDLLRYSSSKPIIIQGETGSGKSTQLPQILLQFCSILDSPQSKPILVTQPRRLATRTLAERVCQQLGEERPNNFVDFKNNMQKQINPNAKIVFKLDRLVLDEITQDPLLQKYSCLVIDEAHQRTISIDVLIGLVRKILDERRDFRVIITSASMDVQLFQREFQTKALKVSGRLYDVAVQYKDYEVQTTFQKIKKVLNQQILRDENSLKQNFQGHVLVFCSSLDQINKLTQIYTKKLNNNRFSIFPLHGKIAPQQQRKVFQSCKQHKIIFASRIAQTAITIDDVRVVVDPGQDIELVYDQKYKFSSMKLRNISQSSAKQRAGRAGRTAPGRCFRLYSQQSYNQRPLGKIPQMENSSLDTVVLRLKSLGIQDVIKFPYISKPDKDGLLASIQNLRMIGGLNQNEQITLIGELLINIPIEPMLARSIIQALLFDEVNKHQISIQSPKDNRSFVQNIVQILCMLVNSSSLFYIFQENQNEGQLRKFEQFDVSNGDFWFLRSIYRQFKQNLKLVGDKAELNFWFKEFYLSKKTLKQVKQLESQILRLVASIIEMKRFKIQKMEAQIDQIKQKLRYCKSWKDVVLSCLITSFVPNLCVYSQDPRIGYTLISQKRPIAIYGTSTLSLVGLNQNSPKWILSYDFYTSEKGKFYCKIAQGIDFKFLKNNINTYVWNKFNLAKAEHINPFYTKVWQNTLPTKVYACLKSQYIRFMGGVGQQAQKRQLYEKSVWIFYDDDNLLKIFVFKDSNGQKEEDIKIKYMAYFEQIKNRYLKNEFRYAYFGNSQAIFTSDFTAKTIQRVIQKDLLISEYLQQDYNLIKKFTKDNFSQHADVEIFPFARNIKIILHEQTNIKYVEKQVQQFFNEAELKQRPKVRQIPRNQRNLSKSKTILVFYVQNIHHKYQNKSQKYYNMLKTFCDLQGSRLQLTEKTDIEWRQQICILLKRVNVNPENCAINVWGNYESFHKMSEFVQVYAEISSFENGVYEKLKQFEGKKQYLGCDKIFIKRTYEQIISFPTETIFKALKEQFLEIVIGEKRKCKDLQILQKSTKMRGIHYVKIIGKSNNRQALIKAAENIQMLFDPKNIELNDQQTKFLLQIDRNKVLFKIQQKHMFGIAFEWNKFSRNLSVYCRSVYFDEIVSQLRKYIKQSNFITNKLSYIGKNLNQVVKILNIHKQNLAKNKIKLSYEILFNKKQISITTLSQFFYQIKTQIQTLSNPLSDQCELCFDKNQSAYILINCSHVFCKVCILGLVKVEVSAHEQPIKCPKNGCTENINIFDIQLILGENLFQKEADERIKKYVTRQDEMSMCPKCLVIIRKQQKQIKDCQICGYKRVPKPKSND